MDESSKRLLEALAAALHGETVSWEKDAVSDWPRLMRLAASHNVMPLLAQAVWDSPVGQRNPHIRTFLSQRARPIVLSQAQRTAAFLLLYQELARRGLDPVIMKGIVCRSLYPCPEQRPSVDEDLLIDPADFPRYHETLLSLGFGLFEAEDDIDKAPEVSYRHPENHLYLEVHKQAFPPDSDAYGDCNALFEGALDRTVCVAVHGCPIRTLSPTDHLLYLLCHAYKHFLHSGVGIRQVCDIGIFAQRYDAEIDWSRVVSDCEKVRILHFSAALFRIAEKYLGFAMPAAFTADPVDELPLLEDILTGGLYGTEDEDRLHSGTMTLDAVAAEKQGRRRKGLLSALFPSAQTLGSRYPYLYKRPWLLPIAWVQRFVGYLKKSDVSASASVRIGEQRVEMLRKYGVID